jgi:hypothetical protein
MNEKPQILAKEVSNEAGVYEITITYSDEQERPEETSSGPSVLRTTPKMFAFQTHLPRAAGG